MALKKSQYGPHLRRLEKEKEARFSINLVGCLFLFVLVMIGIAEAVEYFSK